jgi:hypothetical protein
MRLPLLNSERIAKTKTAALFACHGRENVQSAGDDRIAVSKNTKINYNLPPHTPSFATAKGCRTASGSKLIHIASTECAMTTGHIRMKIGCGVLLTIATALLFPPLAIAIAIIQTFGKNEKDWIFVLFFLRREVVALKLASERRERVQKAADLAMENERLSKEKEENLPANMAELEMEMRALPARINENIRVVGLENYRSASNTFGTTISLPEQYENMKNALRNPAPFHFHGKTESKRRVKNLYEDHIRNSDTNPADMAKKIPDNFFKGVTEKNLTEKNFPRMLAKAMPKLKELAIVCDMPRDSFLLNNGGTIFNLVTPAARQADQNIPQKAKKLHEQRLHEQTRFVLQNLCCEIYKKFPTNEERVHCLRTFLGMPYLQGTHMLAITGYAIELARTHGLSNWKKSTDEEERARIMLHTVVPSIMARATVFYLNDDASITIDANAFCASNVPLFTAQAQILFRDSSLGNYTPIEPPFAYSHVKCTHSYGRNMVIDAAECAYRY